RALRTSPTLRNAPSPTALAPLSLHDALPISPLRRPLRRHCPAPASRRGPVRLRPLGAAAPRSAPPPGPVRPPGSQRRRRSRLFRSEEHTSELQSRENLVCRLLLEKKKKKMNQ